MILLLSAGSVTREDCIKNTLFYMKGMVDPFYNPGTIYNIFINIQYLCNAKILQ